MDEATDLLISQSSLDNRHLHKFNSYSCQLFSDSSISILYLKQ